jgi:hypothetical protein
MVVVQVDYDRLVDDLGTEHRATEAMRSLMAAGMSATPAVRRGLRGRRPRPEEVPDDKSTNPKHRVRTNSDLPSRLPPFLRPRSGACQWALVDRHATAPRVQGLVCETRGGRADEFLPQFQPSPASAVTL